MHRRRPRLCSQPVARNRQVGEPRKHRRRAVLQFDPGVSARLASTGISRGIPSRDGDQRSLRVQRARAYRNAARERAVRVSAREQPHFPGDDSRLGPPHSLSPLKQTRSAPLRSVSAGVGSCSRKPNVSVPDMRAAPEINHKWHPLLRASAPAPRSSGASRKPLDEEIAVVNAEDHPGLDPTAARIILDRGLVRRADFAQPRPFAARISPIRKPPPICTSSPREMITSGFFRVK